MVQSKTFIENGDSLQSIFPSVFITDVRSRVNVNVVFPLQELYFLLGLLTVPGVMLELAAVVSALNPVAVTLPRPGVLLPWSGVKCCCTGSAVPAIQIA